MPRTARYLAAAGVVLLATAAVFVVAGRLLELALPGDVQSIAAAGVVLVLAAAAAAGLARFTIAVLEQALAQPQVDPLEYAHRLELDRARRQADRDRRRAAAAPDVQLELAELDDVLHAGVIEVAVFGPEARS